MNAGKPLIIAHRGTSAFAPENTFAAFRQAVEEKADGIEFDVHLANDGVPVVIHDSNLKRLTNIEGCVADFSSEELQRFDVGSWFNKKHPEKFNDKFSAETVPTLTGLLDFLSDYRGLIYVELKGTNSEIPTLAKKVCELISQTNLLPNIIVKSFNLEGIKITKQILPNIRTAALFEPKILTILRKKRMILDEAGKYNADEISIHYSMATKNFIRRVKEENFTTVIWTTDNPVWIKRALDFGISAIITNNPARFLAKRCEILQEK